MIKININNSSLFASDFHGHVNITHRTIIEFVGYDLLISFNLTSSLYNEKMYEGKHPCKSPALNCFWEKDIWTYLTEQGEFRRGIGENRSIRKANLTEARQLLSSVGR